MKALFKAIGVLYALTFIAGLTTSPAQARNRAAVARVAASAPTVQRGKTTWVTVQIAVARPYHVNSNPASQSYLIPTTVTLASVRGVSIGKARYPKGHMKKFSFSDKAISVYEGTVIVRVPVTVARTAKPGVLRLAGTARYQACDDKNCLMPVNTKFNVVLNVK